MNTQKYHIMKDSKGRVLKEAVSADPQATSLVIFSLTGHLQLHQLNESQVLSLGVL